MPATSFLAKRRPIAFGHNVLASDAVSPWTLLPRPGFKGRNIAGIVALREKCSDDASARAD